MNRAKNKGEHAETFAFFCLLTGSEFFAHGVLSLLTVLAVRRNDAPDGSCNTYTPWDKKTGCITINGIPKYIPNFPEMVKNIWREQKKRGNKRERKYELQAENELLDILGIKQKAGSREKFDVEVKLSHMDKWVGFSIKADWGGNPSLLNASNHTFMKYSLENCIFTLAELTEKQKDLRGLYKNYHKRFGIFCKKSGISWKLHSFRSPTFQKNLGLTAPIYAQLYSNYYLNNTGPQIRKLITDGIEGHSRIECTRYLGDFFECQSYGMVPSKEWNPEDRKTTPGGFISVIGGKIHFRLINDPLEYRQNLCESALLDTPSKVQTKEGNIKIVHRTCQLSEQDGQLFIDLVTGIRMKKPKKLKK